MPLRDLDYQARVLARFDEYLTELAAQKAKADKIAAANVGESDPDLIREVPNFPAKTWRALKEAGKLPPSRARVPYSPRADGMKRAVPNVVFKVPTGGGKTYLAVSALSRIFGRYLGRSTGFVLWIVPNEAIYSQTKRQLTDRQHPYRQMLDVLSGNRVLLMEKGDKLDARDVDASLCVMLLMLQSANRQTNDTLRMFKDRGDVRGFFPHEGVVAAIKSGLEADGLADLVQEIRIADPEGGADGKGPRAIKRRPAFAKTEIYLPEVLRVEDDSVRKLDYEQDILFALDWSGLDPTPLIAKIPDNFQSPEQQMRRIRLVDSGEERIVSEVTGNTGERLAFDPAYAVRMVSDIVPNAWIAREIVGALVAGLQRRGFADETLGKLHGLLIEQLRKWLDGERDRMAEAHFRKEVAAGRIQFRLRTDRHNWAMPADSVTYEPEGADQMLGTDGGPLQRSLFSPIYKNDLGKIDEREVAVYLDAEKSLLWWHRNVARHQYVLQGWRRERIYPDFIFAVQPGNQYGKGKRLVVMETKGDHLKGNTDTEYKQAVLDLMTEAFQIDQTQRVGELSIVNPDGTTVECDLVLMSEWKTKLPGKFPH